MNLTSLFKILSDETRLRILALLYKEDLCVCQIYGVLGLPQSRVSKNLSKLRDLNLVTDSRKDKFVIYSLKRDHILLMSILDHVFSEIEKYPDLLNDYNALNMKETFLTKCIEVNGDQEA